MYYFNTITGHSQYEVPTHPALAAAAPLPPLAADAEHDNEANAEVRPHTPGDR